MRGGNLWVSDALNGLIRTVTPGGQVNTLAGTLYVPPGSLDGPGTQAGFSNPAGLAQDSAGNLYVADQLNNTIRKINSSGEVSTLAGDAGVSGNTDGQGVAARFNAPTGLCVDSQDNLFVADLGGAVRMITPSGMVSTLAAPPAFTSPNCVIPGQPGQLYVSDGNRNAIYTLDIASGTVTLLAGTPGTAGASDGPGVATATSAGASFNNPVGLALVGGNQLVVADGHNNTIRQIDLTSGLVSTVAGLAGQPGNVDGPGATARFFNPIELALDANGGIWVADGNNGTVRVLKPSGAGYSVSTALGIPGVAGTIAGPLPTSLSQPFGILVNPLSGKVYVTVSNAVLQADFTTPQPTMPPFTPKQ